MKKHFQLLLLMRHVVAVAFTLYWATSTKGEPAAHPPSEEFACSTCFTDSGRFEMTRVLYSSKDAELIYVTRPLGSGFVTSLFDPVSKRMLFLWSGSTHSDIAYGWSDERKQGGLLLDEERLAIIDLKGGCWKNLAEVPVEMIQESIRKVQELTWLKFKNDTLVGFPTIVIDGKQRIHQSLCGNEGGTIWIKSNKTEKALVMSFESQQLISVSRMNGKKRDGLCVGWRNGWLVQRAIFSDSVATNGTFIEKINESGFSLSTKQESKVIHQWVVPTDVFKTPSATAAGETGGGSLSQDKHRSRKGQQ